VSRPWAASTERALVAHVEQVGRSDGAGHDFRTRDQLSDRFRQYPQQYVRSAVRDSRFDTTHADSWPVKEQAWKLRADQSKYW
jgi:hypothetical protein